MADKRVTQISTVYDKDDLALATDYLIGDRSGGSSFGILAKDVVHGVLAQTSDPIVVASDINVDSGDFFVDVSTGNVGIGTATPANKLEIGGSFGSLSGTRLSIVGATDFVGMGMGEDANNRCWVLWDTDANILTMGTRAASTSYLDTFVLKDGRVGIGTTSPSVKLQVAGAIGIVDGMTPPSTVSGYALIYVDTTGGDLKIKFGDGTVKTIVTDS